MRKAVTTAAMAVLATGLGTGCITLNLLSYYGRNQEQIIAGSDNARPTNETTSEGGGTLTDSINPSLPIDKIQLGPGSTPTLPDTGTGQEPSTENTVSRPVETDGNSQEPVDPAIPSQPSLTGTFLWKPVSENTGKLVVLLPGGLTGHVSSVRALSLAAGERSLSYSGDKNPDSAGNRSHWRDDIPGADYGEGVVVTATLKDGTEYRWDVPNGAERTSR